MNYFTLSPPPSHWAELCKKASHSLILLPGFSSYRQIQCSWSPAVTVLTLSPSQLWRKGEKTGSFPEPFLFLSPRKRGLEGWRGGRLRYSRQPSLKCSCDPAGFACSPICPIAVKCAEWNSPFFKGAKVSRVWNGSRDTVNVLGLPAMMFNQRLNTRCITFPSLAQWQLPHHSPLFPGNIDFREAPWSHF